MAKSNFTENGCRQEDDALSMLDEVMECAPALSEKDVQTIESAFTDPGFAYARRAGLAIAAQGGDWFRQLSQDEEMALPVVMVLGNLTDHAQWLRKLADVIDIGRQRATLALTPHGDLALFAGIDSETLH
jgi:hypothetical protein